MQTPEALKFKKWRSIPRLWRRLEGEDGQSLIEPALTLPMLLAMLVGAVEFGRLSYAAIEGSSAARAGVAYGSQSQINAADLTGMQTAATNDAQDVTVLAATAIEICKCTDGTIITCATATTKCLGPARTLEFIQVNTRATVDPLFYVPGLPKRYTLTGQAIMRVVQ